jgi:hypothetical protein
LSSISIGSNASNNTATNSIVIGTNSSVTGSDSLVIGPSSTSTSTNTIILGESASSGGNNDSIVINNSSLALTASSSSFYVGTIRNNASTANLRWNSANKEITYDSGASDIRIKKDFEDIINPLNLIQKIDVKQFEYINKEYSNDVKHIGFLGQNVKNIFPSATSLIKDFLPNIMIETLCEFQSNNILKLCTSLPFLQLDNILKLKNKNTNNEMICKVIDLWDEFIIVESYSKQYHIVNNISVPYQQGDIISVFIYGTETNDVITVNKEKLFILNFSATKHLYNLLEWHINNNNIDNISDPIAKFGKSLRSENNDLLQRISNLENKISSLGL